MFVSVHGPRLGQGVISWWSPSSPRVQGWRAVLGDVTWALWFQSLG